jgi:hypothetical protein
VAAASSGRTQQRKFVPWLLTYRGVGLAVGGYRGEAFGKHSQSSMGTPLASQAGVCVRPLLVGVDHLHLQELALVLARVSTSCRVCAGWTHMHAHDLAVSDEHRAAAVTLVVAGTVGELVTPYTAWQFQIPQVRFSDMYPCYYLHPAHAVMVACSGVIWRGFSLASSLRMCRFVVNSTTGKHMLLPVSPQRPSRA